MRKVLVLDTSVLCVWLQVPGKETCGAVDDVWDRKRVNRLLKNERSAGSTFVLPMATIIETGNHISQADSGRFEKARELAKIMEDAAEQRSTWAAFTEQSHLWDEDGLKELAKEWPELAKSGFSIGDATIKHVAELYAKMGYAVEILTGDTGLKAYEPMAKPLVPRRRKAGR